MRDVVVTMTPAERELYEAVEGDIGTTYDNASQDQRAAVGFVMTIYRRRLASSFHALRQTLTKRLADGRLALDEGDLPEGERVDEPLDAEEAAEGLNFQACGVVINLDLPRNPMKVEQRIGRVDRIGQVHPKIRVVNFAYEDTVEADVYFALGRRINLFQGIVGRLQPTLSRLPGEFERVALEPQGVREAARHRLVAEVEGLVREAESSGFNVDEAAGESLEPPALPSPALTLEDRALNRPGVLPPGVEWERLDAGSYALRLEGRYEAESGRLILSPTQGEALDGRVTWLGPDRFLFQLLGGGREDPRLEFHKSPNPFLGNAGPRANAGPLIDLTI